MSLMGFGKRWVIVFLCMMTVVASGQTIKNGSFENGFTNWENQGMKTQTNTVFNIKAGTTYAEKWTDKGGNVGDGLTYVWCGFIITVLPILIMGFIAKKFVKLNYCTLMGLIAGSNTDPPALAFANQTAGNEAPAVGYSTVYPLSMFMRILTAQLIILLMCA